MTAARVPGEVLVSGLAFPEGPRWHRDALYFSDVHSHQVLRWRAGTLEVVAHVPGRPSGLGFLDEETLLVSSQEDRRVHRVDLRTPGAPPVVHADLGRVATWHLNDLLTDARGRAYVGNYGDGAPPGEPIAPAALALVDVDGSVRAVADELFFPNGMALLDEGRTLVVAETRSEPGRLTAFDVSADGSLRGRRTLIAFTGHWPDGIAADRHGTLWVACPFDAEVLRVSADGRIVGRVAVPDPYAVAIGGDDGTDLFVATADTWVPEEAAVVRSGRILVFRGVAADAPR